VLFYEDNAASLVDMSELLLEQQMKRAMNSMPLCWCMNYLNDTTEEETLDGISKQTKMRMGQQY